MNERGEEGDAKGMKEGVRWNIKFKKAKREKERKGRDKKSYIEREREKDERGGNWDCHLPDRNT